MVAPCGACKFRKKGCKRELCVFAPDFPIEKRKKFEFLNRVFGASRVSKFINNLQPSQCNEAMDSLSYEAEQRIREPVFGCVSQVTLLKADLAKFQEEIAMVKKKIEAFGKQEINLNQAVKEEDDDEDVLASKMLNSVAAVQSDTDEAATIPEEAATIPEDAATIPDPHKEV